MKINTLLFFFFFLSGCTHANKIVVYQLNPSKGFSIEKVTYFSHSITPQERTNQKFLGSIVKSSVQNDEINVGIVEFGESDLENVTVKKFGYKEFLGKFDDHVKGVIASFRKTHFNKKVNIYNCAIENTTFLQECLEWLKENKVVGINFSIWIYAVVGTTYETMEQLLADDVVITVAAGNDDKPAAGICSEYEKIICVGMKDKEGNIFKPSNYGPYVKAWDYGFISLLISDSGDGIQHFQIQSGSSFAAPRQLAKILKQRFDSDN